LHQVIASAQAVGALHHDIALFVTAFYILDTTLVSLLPGSFAAILGFAVRFLFSTRGLLLGGYFE
jgi:hypothetical protein